MKIELTTYVVNVPSFLAGNYENCFCVSMNDDWDIDGWVKAGTATLKIDIDIGELTAKAVDKIDKAIEEEKAKSREKVLQMQEAKASLLSIEYLPAGDN